MASENFEIENRKKILILTYIHMMWQKYTATKIISFDNTVFVLCAVFCVLWWIRSDPIYSTASWLQLIRSQYYFLAVKYQMSNTNTILEKKKKQERKYDKTRE